MTRSHVLRRLDAYEKGQHRVRQQRELLRMSIIDWHDRGATIVEIASALGWSRQSVYDLIGK